MKRTLIGGACAVVTIAMCAVMVAHADDPPTPKTPNPQTPTPQTPNPQTPNPEKPAPVDGSVMSPKEQAFAKLLTGAVLEGTWRMTHFDKPQEEMKLGEHQTDRYEIVSAVKTSGEHWVITARIVYADRDVNLPVPVRVVWADDTPMITLTELTMPILGKYSARVIFHHGFYSGVWYGAGYGGVLSGQVTHAQSSDKPSEQQRGTE